MWDRLPPNAQRVALGLCECFSTLSVQSVPLASSQPNPEYRAPAFVAPLPFESTALLKFIQGVAEMLLSSDVEGGPGHPSIIAPSARLRRASFEMLPATRASSNSQPLLQASLKNMWVIESGPEEIERPGWDAEFWKWTLREGTRKASTVIKISGTAMAANVAYSATAQAKESRGREVVESVLDWYLPPVEIEFTTESGPILEGGVPWNRIGHFRMTDQSGTVVCARCGWEESPASVILQRRNGVGVVRATEHIFFDEEQPPPGYRKCRGI